MKNKKKNTLLAGLLLSALTIPLTIDSAYSADRLIVNSGETVTVDEQFANIITTENGGAIFNNGGILNVEQNASFEDNTAYRGSGIYNYLNGTLTVADGVKFTDNTATGAAGGGLQNFGTANLGDNLVFDGNKAVWGGAAIYAGSNSNSGSTTIIGDNAKFTNNTLTGTDVAVGGAIFVENDSKQTVKLQLGQNAYFEENEAIIGGAVFVKQLVDATIGDGAQFVSNSATQAGGAIFNASNELALNKATFKTNTSGGNGGAIYNGVEKAGDPTPNVTITNSTFTGNTATAEGGALYNAGSFDIDGTTFTGNTGANGGAIASYAATSDTLSTIKNATFDGNKATGAVEADGGAISLQNGILEITDNTKFVNNSAAVGGAIYTYTKKEAQDRDCSLTLDGVEFTNNEATLSGGALMNMNDATISNSTFKGNKVTTDANEADGGGAIFVGSVSSTKITNTTFTENSSKKDGGAIATRQPQPGDGYSDVGNNTAAKLEIAGSTFTGNTASLDGGAIYNSLKDVAIADTDFSGNTATGNGGAIFTDKSNGNDEQTSVAITGSNFTGNTAANGGAIFAEGDLDITGGTFKQNSTDLTKTSYGGAIVSRYGTTTIKEGTEFIENKSTIGGAIAVYGNNDLLDISDAKFVGNQAIQGNTAGAAGGAIFNLADATIKNTVFENNSVTSNDTVDGGGAMFLGSESSTTLDNVAFTGNKSNQVGGAIATRQPAPGEGTGNNSAAVLEIKNGSTFINNEAGTDGGAIYSAVQGVKISDTDFSGNKAANNGGAIFTAKDNGNGQPTDIEITDSSFTNNSATGNGGAIYSNANVTIKSETEDVTFSGNTASDGGDIFMAQSNSNLNIETATDRTVTIASGISGVAGAEGTSGFNTNVTGTGTLNVQSYINNTNMAVESGSTLWLNEGSSLGEGTKVTMNDGSALNTINNSTDTFGEELTMVGNVSISADIDAANGKADNFAEANTENAEITITEVNDISSTSSSTAVSNFNLLEALGLDKEKTTIAEEIIASSANLAVLDPIAYMQGSIDANGNVTYAPRGNSYNDYNPAVMASSVAAQLGGYLTQLNSYDQAFRNMDMYMLMTKSQRQALKNANKYAAADSDLVFDPINTPYTDKAGWFRPYANFESVGLKNGPKVSNVMYGTFAGLDSELVELGNGWDGMMSLYAGYNGSHQAYQGNSIYQNGGTLGLVGMAYKDNFFTGLTANIGANIADASTMYGSEDFSMLMTGIASKTGYNFELADGKFIIQPSYMMSYSMVNTFDYTNAAGVRINTDPLHAIQIEPGIKFIGNLKNGWQPYAGVSVVFNIMDDTKFKANDVSLPELSVKPYAKYGVGVRKTWGERLTGFFQTFITSGGRNGVGFQGGFRWTLGNDKAPKKANSTGERKVVKAKA